MLRARIITLHKLNLLIVVPYSVPYSKILFPLDSKVSSDFFAVLSLGTTLLSNNIRNCGVLVSSNCPLRMLNIKAPKNANANSILKAMRTIITDMGYDLMVMPRLRAIILVAKVTASTTLMLLSGINMAAIKGVNKPATAILMPVTL